MSEVERLGFSDLLAAAQRGDDGAVTEMYRRFAPAILGRVRDRLSPTLRRRYDTLDIGQSVFVEVLSDLPRFQDRGEAAFRGWLYLKAESKVRMKLRRHFDRRGRPREVRLGTSEEATRPGSGPGPATGAGDAEERARLEAMLGELTDAQREVVALRIRESLTFVEIADRLGLPGPDAARMRYARALRTLRKRWPR